MLTGEFNHSIDSKGRLIIPSKLRESLGEQFVITKGMDGCLFLYPDNEWKAFEEKLRTLPLTNKTADVEENIEDIASDMEDLGLSI